MTLSWTALGGAGRDWAGLGGAGLDGRDGRGPVSRAGQLGEAVGRV
jgi:hypothetical protein